MDSTLSVQVNTNAHLQSESIENTITGTSNFKRPWHKLGSGGFGSVYKVHHEPTHKTYALKEIDISFYKNSWRERFSYELDHLPKLDNTYIVKSYGYFTEEDSKGNSLLYIIMELCEGGDLQSYIEDLKSPIESEVVWKFLIEMCLGLRYLHDQKTFHRDLKPGNILLTYDKQNIKIGDLGLARMKKEVSKTQVSLTEVKGTKGYMPPEFLDERVIGGVNYSEQTDIWGLGCILYELCVQRPFHELWSKRNGRDYRDEIRKGILDRSYDINLACIVQECLARNPTMRCSTSDILLKSAVYDRMEKYGITHEWIKFGNQIKTLDNGSKYRGGWSNNQKNGKGEYIWEGVYTYIGDYVDDLRHGHGEVVFSNGNKYKGSWVKDKMNGKGKYTYKNGDVYIGDLVDGLRHGQCEIIYSSGDKYKGIWMKGGFNGKGEYIYKNGDRYIGNFADGLRHGQGEIIYSNGSRIASEWVRGKFVNKNGCNCF